MAWAKVQSVEEKPDKIDGKGTKKIGGAALMVFISASPAATSCHDSSAVSLNARAVGVA